MKSYINLAKFVLENGKIKQNRTGINTIWLSGQMIKHDMRSGFPLLTTKKMFYKSAAVELEGFIGGITDKSWYKERGCNIWNHWANPLAILQDFGKGYSQYKWSKELKNKLAFDSNDLGPIYGYQWRRFGMEYKTNRPNGKCFAPIADDMDQLNKLVTTLKLNPLDRRMVVSAWCPPMQDLMALPPCHLFFQVMSDGEFFDLTWYQRSVDIALGLPFDIFHYAMMMLLLEKSTGLKPRYLAGSLGDCHIYMNHLDNIKEQIKREPLPLPKVELFDINSINGLDYMFHWTHLDFRLNNYKHHDKIGYEVAI